MNHLDLGIPLKTFAELELIAPVQRALAEEQYVTPTPIQAQTIPSAVGGRDVLGSAQTGTGKTAAFALPILNHLGKQNRKAIPNRPNALILAPTRELAIQIGESFATYGRHLRLRQALVYGGVGQGNQVRMLSRGAHILVATPGRLIDLMNQGHIHLDRLEVFVLDEADRMLDMGFLPDLKRIISKLPEERQSLFFSATLPPKITELSETLLRNPVSVNVTPETRSVDLIEQRVVFVERSGKQGLLRDLLIGDDVDRVVVFTRTKRGANTLAEQLERSGFRATAIHGNKSQGARQKALDAFRRKHVNVLVATDVAARGIDVDGVTHVVNFDIPDEPESYVHRIGRTGRAGASGLAVSFCSSSERRELRAIEQLIGQRIPLAANQPEPPPRDESTAEESRGRSGSGRPGRRPDRRGRKPYAGSGKPRGPRTSEDRGYGGPAAAASEGEGQSFQRGRQDRRPAQGEQRPGRGERRPPRGDGDGQSFQRGRQERRPAQGEQRPGRGERRPTRGEGRPAQGESRSSQGEHRPTRGEGRPAQRNGRPPQGGKRPSRNNNEGGNRPETGEHRPARAKIKRRPKGMAPRQRAARQD